MVGHDDLQAKLSTLRSIVDGSGRVQENVIAELARDIDLARLNTKFFGYEVAARLAEGLPKLDSLDPRKVNLTSKACTQSDIEADWFAYWCNEMRIARVFHRKVWEVCYFLQVLHDHGMIRPGVSGVGFGVGSEAIPAYLASKGVSVTVTDLPPTDVSAKGWLETNQWTAGLDRLFVAELVDRETFERQVSLRYEDMNAISPELNGFDFCWSLCALEHLGTIEKGLTFIYNSMETIRPGGVSIHTTEFNFFNNDQTIDNWSTVLFQKRHLEDVAERLLRKGHKVRPLDFNVGNKPMDRFIDLPPYVHQWGSDVQAWWGGDDRHLKLSIDGFACTCFGIIVERG